MRYCRDDSDVKKDSSKKSKRAEKTKILKSKLDLAHSRIAELEERLSRTAAGLVKLDEKIKETDGPDDELSDTAETQSLPETADEEEGREEFNDPTEITGLRNRKNKGQFSKDEFQKNKNTDSNDKIEEPVSIEELKDLLTQVSSLKSLAEAYKSDKGW